MLLSALLLLSAATDVPATTAAPPAAAAANRPTAAGTKKICRSEAATGSIMRKKTCRTKADWDAASAAAREQVDRVNAVDRSRSLVDSNR